MVNGNGNEVKSLEVDWLKLAETVGKMYELGIKRLKFGNFEIERCERW